VLVDPPRIGTSTMSRTHKCRRCVRSAPLRHGGRHQLGQHLHPKYRIERRVQGYDETWQGPLLRKTSGLRLSGCSAPFRRMAYRLEQLDN